MKSIDLNREYYNECISKIIAEHYPSLGENYAAALLGWGSEVLGNDDEFSKAYGWGPRIVIFLQEHEYEKHYQYLHDVLKTNLPVEFAGYPTRFTDPSQGPPLPTRKKSGLPQVPITTCQRFIQLYLGIDSCTILASSLSSKDWLLLSEDKLLRVTAGEVYHDGVGKLSTIRRNCSYFPDDVWKYKLSYQWKTLSWDIDLIGLCAERDDYFSTEIAIMESIKRIIRLIFLLNKTYAPGYLKWLHREFGKLSFLSDEVGPLLKKIVSIKSTNIPEVLALFYHIIDALVAYQSTLLHIDIPPYKTPSCGDRGFFAYDLTAIIGSITVCIPGILKSMPFQNGALDQWVFDQDILMSPTHLKLLASIYDASDPEKENLSRTDTRDFFL
jgi:hypothetical protein